MDFDGRKRTRGPGDERLLMNICFITASNNEEVLRSSLLASPDLAGVEVNVQRGAPSAGVAYNRGIQSSRAEIMVFVHQDIYLPKGWLAKLEKALAQLERQDPNWGVLGLFGTEPDGTGQGLLYSTGLGVVLGSEFEGARPVRTLDEVMLIVRRASGLRFDETLEGFHLYGADISLEAESRGMKCYAISAHCIHNTNGIGLLPWAYWKCYLRLRRKWSSRLPVSTPCMDITRWGMPALNYLLRRPVWLLRHRHRLGRRVPDPSPVWRQLQTKELASQTA